MIWQVSGLAWRCMARFLATLEPGSQQAWARSSLLAAASLLVTSKIVSSRPLSAKLLLQYGGGEFLMEELMVRSVLVCDDEGGAAAGGWGGWLPFASLCTQYRTDKWQTALPRPPNFNSPTVEGPAVWRVSQLNSSLSVLRAAPALQAGLGRLPGLRAGGRRAAGQSHVHKQRLKSGTQNLHFPVKQFIQHCCTWHSFR